MKNRIGSSQAFEPPGQPIRFDRIGGPNRAGETREITIRCEAPSKKSGSSLLMAYVVYFCGAAKLSQRELSERVDFKVTEEKSVRVSAEIVRFACPGEKLQSGVTSYIWVNGHSNHALPFFRTVESSPLLPDHRTKRFFESLERYNRRLSEELKAKLGIEFLMLE